MTRVFVPLLFAAVLVLAGCKRPTISGHYSDDASSTSYEFKKNGKATVVVLDSSVVAEYTIDGNKVLVSSPQGTVVLTMKGNRLLGPMGQELIRQPD